MIYLLSKSVSLFILRGTGIQKKVVHVSFILKFKTRTKRLSSALDFFAGG